MDKIFLVLVLLLLYFYTVTCTFFAAEIAILKGRRRSWGWLGLLLGLIGIIIVCFLPNAKGVEGETNPVKALLRKWTAVSPVALWVVVTGVVIVAGGALLGTRLTTYLDNRAYEKELSETESNEVLLTPTKVIGKVKAVFCGDDTNYAVTESGDLYGWGKVGMTSLDESGKVYEKVKKVSEAGDTLYLLTMDGTLYAKGDNKNGRIPGQTAEYAESLVKIEEKVLDAVLSETVGAILKEDGSLYVVGANTYGQLGRAEEQVSDTKQKLAEKVSKVVVTGRSLYYLTADGLVYGVGSNAFGQFGLGHRDAQGVPVKLTDHCKDIAAGEDFLLVLKKDGTVWSAGNNCYGQLGRQIGDGIKEEDASEESVVLMPENVFGQVAVLSEVTHIEAGRHSALALIGTDLFGWGQNHLGQLGDDLGNLDLPTIVYRKVTEMAAGGDCTLLVTEDGTLLGAGDRQYGQLGTRSGKDGFLEIAEVKEAKN